MSHCVAYTRGGRLHPWRPASAGYACSLDLDLNIRDSHPGEHAAVATSLAKTLASFLLEDPEFGSACLAVDHANDLGVGDERRAREHFARFLFDEQHLIEREFGS